jgi:hypothetical protein
MGCDSFKSPDWNSATEESAVTCFLLLILNFGSLRASFRVATGIPLAKVPCQPSNTALTLPALPVVLQSVPGEKEIEPIILK